MSATITSTSQRITISGNYKAFTSTAGSTSTVIQYSSGDAPASGDAGRFLLWKNGSATKDWQIRYIESATSSTVTVGDGGFSSAPASGEDFVISTNLADIQSAVPSACTVAGKSYSFNGRDWGIINGAFLGDVNVSLDTEQSVNTSGYNAWNAANGCAVQFGRLTGGEANDSTITRQGCYISLNSTKPSANSNVFGSGGSEVSNGPIFNFYGCYIKNYTPTASDWAFMRGTGPVRFIGSIWDGPIGGAFYHSASELVDTKFRGNTNLTPAWSIRATFVRPVSNVQFANGLAAFKTFQSYTGIFRDTVFDLDSLGVVVFVSGSTDGGVTCIDSTTFTDSDITDSGSGFVHQAKSINYTLTDSSGIGLTGAKVAVYDTDGTLQGSLQTSSSGTVDEIVATFSKWQNSSPSANKAPFDIRIRKYGYQYQDFQSAVSEPIKQEFRLPANTVTVLSEASAGALSGIVIDFAAKTVTITAARSLSEIYDYCQSQLALDANMDEPEFLTSLDGNVFTFADDWDLVLNASGSVSSASGKTLVFGGTGVLEINDASSTIDNLTIDGDVHLNALATPLTEVVADAIDFDIVGTYILDGGKITEVTNSSAGFIQLNLTNGATVTTNTGPNITLQQLVNITASNIIDGSRVQIYNVTKSSEIDNSVVSGGSGYSISVNLLSASVDDGDTIRLRATYTSGTTAKDEALSTGILGTNGLSFLTTQDNNVPYNTLALDGSTITKFTADYVNDEVDISIASDFTLAEFYAWWAYNTTTSQGISDFFGGVTAVDEANFKINNSVVNIYFDNATATNISQTDNRRVYREDGVRPVVGSTSGGGGIDVEWRSPVTIAASETIQSSLTDILDDTDELQQNQGDWLTATGFSTFNPASDQVIVSTNNDKTGYSIFGTKNTLDDLNDVSASDVYIEFTTGSNEDVFKADVSNLDVAVSTRNSVAPDNAGIAANGNAISALNNFDPASDQVIVSTNNDKTNYSLTTVDKDDIVDRNWDEPYSQHTTAGTFGKLMDLLRKSNRAIEGEVTGTPTISSFSTNLTGYAEGTFDSELLVFVSGSINGEARPILNYSSGTFTFEEEWTQAPSSGDEFVILPQHIHPISQIQEGLSTFDANTDTVANVTTVQTTISNTDMRGTDGANTIAPDNASIATTLTNTNRVDGLIEDVNGDRFTQKALEEALSGGSGTLDVNIISVDGNSVSSTEDFKADVSNLDVLVSSRMASSSYVAPDNTGISNIQVDIAALNDISIADVKLQVDQALDDYDVDTKTHVKPSISL